MVHKLPAIKVNGAEEQVLLLHPECGVKLSFLLGHDLFELQPKGTLSKDHLQPRQTGNRRMLNKVY
jgi:hypothetical protein